MDWPPSWFVLLSDKQYRPRGGGTHTLKQIGLTVTSTATMSTLIHGAVVSQVEGTETYVTAVMQSLLKEYEGMGCDIKEASGVFTVFGPSGAYIFSLTTEKVFVP